MNTTTAHPIRRFGAVLATILVTLLAAGLSASSASAQNNYHVFGTGGIGVAIRLGSPFGTRVQGPPEGAYNITLECQTTGPTINGTAIWDRLSWNGTDGFVPDAYIWTGYDGFDPRLPRCGNTPAVAPVSTPSRMQQAAKWAVSMLGRTGYNGWCEKFVENAYGTSGRYPTAIANFYAQRAAGRISTTTTNIPAGALVFFNATSRNGWAGHVEISAGDGTFITSAYTVTRVNLSWGGQFIGWAPQPAGW